MKDSLPALALFVVIVAVALAIPQTRAKIAKDMETSSHLRDEVQAADVAATRTELQKERLKQEVTQKEELQALETADAGRGNLIAINRYRSNCRAPQVIVNNRPVGLTIREGMKIVDPITRLPLQEGTSVCDSIGGTGLIDREGRVTQFARLTDTPKSVLDPDTFNRYFKPVAPSVMRREATP